MMDARMYVCIMNSVYRFLSNQIHRNGTIHPYTPRNIPKP